MASTNLGPAPLQACEVQPEQGEWERDHLSPRMRAFQQQLAWLWLFLQDMRSPVLTQQMESKGFGVQWARKWISAVLLPAV